MTKQELINALAPYDDDSVVICMGEDGGWDNILEVKGESGKMATITIVFGGGNPFSDGG